MFIPLTPYAQFYDGAFVLVAIALIVRAGLPGATAGLLCAGLYLAAVVTQSNVNFPVKDVLGPARERRLLLADASNGARDWRHRGRRTTADSRTRRQPDGDPRAVRRAPGGRIGRLVELAGDTCGRISPPSSTRTTRRTESWSWTTTPPMRPPKTSRPNSRTSMSSGAGAMAATAPATTSGSRARRAVMSRSSTRMRGRSRGGCARSCVPSKNTRRRRSPRRKCCWHRTLRA